MNYIEDMFNRADLQQIVGFILYGSETKNPQRKPYKQMIEEVNDNFISFLESICDKKSVLMQLTDKYISSVAALEDIYTEIGVKLSAKILIQLHNHNGPL